MVCIVSVDDQIALENYVREQKEKGYSDDEIREILRKANWDRRLIEDVLINVKVGETDSGIDKYAKYDKYIRDDEVIKSVYNISATKIIVTNERVIVIKHFPQSQIKVNFTDIENIEYFTDISWKYLFISWFSLFAVLFIYSYHEVLSQQIIAVLPFLVVLINKSLIFGYNILTFFISLGLFVLFFYYGWKFVDTLFGRLRIYVKNQAPIDIVTKLNFNVEQFIKEIELLEKHLNESRSNRN